MKKRTLALVVSLVLALALGLGGTLAYLTDTDSDVNVMVVGNVSIEQIEMQRAKDVEYNAEAEEGDLVLFAEGKPLYPAYAEDPSYYTAKPGSSGSYDTMKEMFKWGDYTSVEMDGNGLWDDKLMGAIDKFVFVKNTGTSDCYFRTWIAFECPDGMEYSAGSDKHFMMNVNAAYSWERIGYDEIDGVRYLIYCATYADPRNKGTDQAILRAGETARPSLLQVVMTGNATSEHMKLLGDTYEILAFTQACQTTNFPNAETALTAAFGKAEVKNHPWVGTEIVIPPFTSNVFAEVTVLDEDTVLPLKKTDGTEVTIVDKDLTIDTTGSKMGVPLGVIKMNALYQFEPSITLEECLKGEYADWHADFVVKANKAVPANSIGLAGYYDAWCSLNNDKWVLLTNEGLEIEAGEEIRLVYAMGNGSITVSYEEICKHGNDGIGFLCGLVALNNIDAKYDKLEPGTVVTVELRLYEATGGGSDTETGEYITTGVYEYEFK